MSEKMRAEFEAALVAVGYVSTTFFNNERDAGPEGYCDHWLRGAWKAWKLRQPEIDALQARIAELEYEARWIREKLKLPADTQLLRGEKTLAGTMHVVCHRAHGYVAYIEAYKCDDKQGEIGRLSKRIADLEANRCVVVLPEYPEMVCALWDVFNGKEWLMTVTSPLEWDAKAVKDTLLAQNYAPWIQVALRHSMTDESLCTTITAADVKDARRYQWLRKHYEVSLVIDFFGNGCVNKTIEMVEAAIDAAMAGQDAAGGE